MSSTDNSEFASMVGDIKIAFSGYCIPVENINLVQHVKEEIINFNYHTSNDFSACLYVPVPCIKEYSIEVGTMYSTELSHIHKIIIIAVLINGEIILIFCCLYPSDLEFSWTCLLVRNF